MMNRDILVLAIASASLFCKSDTKKEDGEAKKPEPTVESKAPDKAPNPEPKAEPAAAATPWPEPFGAFVPGASFKLGIPKVGEEPREIEWVQATVKSMTADKIELVWVDPQGQPYEDSMPNTIVRKPDGFWIGGSMYADATFPAKVETTKLPSGIEVQVDGDIVCYTDGPGEGAGDCEDICFAEMCVHKKKGLVSLGGNWAPEQFIAIHVDCKDNDKGGVICP